MVEKYGIELEILTSSFKKKVEETKAMAKNFGAELKQNFTTGMYFDKEKAKRDLDEQVRNVEIAQKKIQSLTAQQKAGWTILPEEFTEANRQLKEAQNNLANVQKDINSLNTTSGMLGSAFNKVRESVKKLGVKLHLVKQSSDGVIKDSGLPSLGNKIVNGMQKATKSIKRFALSLFGIRSIYALVSRASSAYMSQDIELTKKMQGAWASLGAMMAPIMEYIANMLVKIVGYVNVFMKSFLKVDLLAKASAKYMNKMAQSAKETMKALAGIDEITNLNQMNNIENPFATVQNTTLDPDMENKIASLGEKFGVLVEKIKPVFQWIKDEWKTILDALLVGGFVFDIITGNWIGAITKFGVWFTIHWNEIMGEISGITGLKIEDMKFAFDMLWKGIQLGLMWLINVVRSSITFFVTLVQGLTTTITLYVINWVNNIKGVINGIIDFVSGIFTGDWEKAWNGIKDIGVNAFQMFINGVKMPLNLLIDFINAIINGINSIDVKMPDWAGGQEIGFNIPKIPKLATGTNMIENEGLYYLHKNEAVVPEKYNPAVGNGNDMPTTIIVNVAGEKMYEKTIDYINDKSRMLGESVINV